MGSSVQHEGTKKSFPEGSQSGSNYCLQLSQKLNLNDLRHHPKHTLPERADVWEEEGTQEEVKQGYIFIIADGKLKRGLMLNSVFFYNSVKSKYVCLLRYICV